MPYIHRTLIHCKTVGKKTINILIVSGKTAEIEAVFHGLETVFGEDLSNLSVNIIVTNLDADETGEETSDLTEARLQVQQEMARLQEMGRRPKNLKSLFLRVDNTDPAQYGLLCSVTRSLFPGGADIIFAALIGAVLTLDKTFADLLLGLLGQSGVLISNGMAYKNYFLDTAKPPRGISVMDMSCHGDWLYVCVNDLYVPIITQPLWADEDTLMSYVTVSSAPFVLGAFKAGFDTGSHSIKIGIEWDTFALSSTEKSRERIAQLMLLHHRERTSDIPSFMRNLIMPISDTGSIDPEVWRQAVSILYWTLFISMETGGSRGITNPALTLDCRSDEERQVIEQCLSELLRDTTAGGKDIIISGEASRITIKNISLATLVESSVHRYYLERVPSLHISA